MNKRIFFSGIQPSGSLHIGNYIGAIRQWVDIQNDDKFLINLISKQSPKPELEIRNLQRELIFCVVDLHAITVYQDPKILREKILEVAAIYLACGIDPKKSRIFIQSENPDHSYLSWILDTVIPYGWMGRMTQFKSKSEQQKGATSVGLFNYPALMAADILLYDTDFIPVGEDQIQHIELARDTAIRFNRIYNTKLFKLPESLVDQEAARIMSLQNPLAKMSKSVQDPLGTINLLDSSEDVKRKIKRAVTDSGNEIVYRQDKPALSNLLVIYSRLSGKPIKELEKQYQGVSYVRFKEDLADVVDNVLKPIREKYAQIRQNYDYLSQVLNEGRDFALSRSQPKVAQVRQVMGLGR